MLNWHILHVLDHSLPLQSGYAFRTLALLRQQEKMGWKVTCVTGQKHLSIHEELAIIEGFKFYRTQQQSKWIHLLPLIGQLGTIFALARRIIAVAKAVQPDVIHAHSPALNGLAALWAGKRLGLPVVYEVRAFWEDAAVSHGTSREWGLRYRLSRALESYVFRHVQAITVICEGLRQEIVARGISKQHITIIPNAVDIQQFSRSDVPSEILVDQLGVRRRIVLGFAGSFYEYEGLHLLIQALPKIRSQRPEVVLLLVGGGPFLAKLQYLVQTLGLEESVLFVGRIPQNKIPDYYALMDLLVYPRLNIRLTHLVTPLKPLEAMASGTLVLASDVGGHKELIKNGFNGYLFQAENVDHLVQTILQILSNKNSWELVRDNALRYVRNERNWETSVANYRNTYSCCQPFAHNNRGES
ncbi:MAG: glycosyltransferase, exosortase A system-associated [Magnetococcus sp. DMHC-6]